MKTFCHCPLKILKNIFRKLGREWFKNVASLWHSTNKDWYLTDQIVIYWKVLDLTFNNIYIVKIDKFTKLEDKVGERFITAYLTEFPNRK